MPTSRKKEFFFTIPTNISFPIQRRFLPTSERKKLKSTSNSGSIKQRDFKSFFDSVLTRGIIWKRYFCYIRSLKVFIQQFFWSSRITDRNPTTWKSWEAWFTARTQGSSKLFPCPPIGKKDCSNFWERLMWIPDMIGTILLAKKSWSGWRNEWKNSKNWPKESA